MKYFLEFYWRATFLLRIFCGSKNGMKIFTLILEQKCEFALCGLVLQKRFTSMIPRWIAMDLVKQNVCALINLIR